MFCLAIGLMVDISTYLDLGNSQLEGPGKKIITEELYLCHFFRYCLIHQNMGFIYYDCYRYMYDGLKWDCEIHNLDLAGL